MLSCGHDCFHTKLKYHYTINSIYFVFDMYVNICLTQSIAPYTKPSVLYMFIVSYNLAIRPKLAMIT